MGLSPGTVKANLCSVMCKLGSRNRMEAVNSARAMGPQPCASLATNIRPSRVRVFCDSRWSGIRDTFSVFCRPAGMSRRHLP
ncbi:hypothetical protein ACTMTI_54410 [Nonomuraea sp. H19]|uniref:hypothetical protein n=1 Tax=Nonomuraea sp. H19 TaxID=3452206 RepID=UPI003F8A8FE9